MVSMKKALLLLVLMLAVAAFACAEGTGEREAELFDLWMDNGESTAWVAAAVPVTDGVVVTARAVLPEDTEHLVVSDGKSVWQAKGVVPDSTGLMATILFETQEQAPRYGAWRMLSLGKSVPVSACTVRSGDRLGSRINRVVLSSSEMNWRDSRCLLLTLEEEVPLGSPVLTGENELAGIVVAEYAEGNGRMVALPAEEIARGLNEVSALLTNLPGWGNMPEGYKVTVARNNVTFDWSGMALPEKAEGESLYLVVVDTGNDYLNFYPAETEERSLTLALVPGRVYLSGIVASRDIPSEYPQQYTTTILPEADRVTDHQFRSKICAIAEAPEGGASDEHPPVPVTEVTEELLRSGRAYFYSASEYKVTEPQEGLSLLITLTTPAGVNYRYESTWVYGPDYMDNDVWYIPLTASGLTDALDQKGYPRGVYGMAFYINGELADTVEFELK